MAPAQNDAFDFFMAETTCSDPQNEVEDPSLDNLLQQIKAPVHSGLSDVCDVSEGGDTTLDFMCDQSSAQFTLDNTVNDSIVNSTSEILEGSPAQSSTYVGHSPLSSSSLAATAGTRDSWPNATEDDGDVCSSSQGRKKTKASPGSSPQTRPPLPGYQSMTPWTSDITPAAPSYASTAQEIPCFFLDPQVLRGQGSESQNPQQSPQHLPNTLHTVTTAVTETVNSLPSWKASLATHAQGRIIGPSVLKGPHRTAAAQQHNREKRFKKTAEALQKCGLWDIAMKTGNLIKRNAELQKEIEALRQESTQFLKSVIQNPENQGILGLVDNADGTSPPNRGQRLSPTDGAESDTTTTTTVTTGSKISDSGYSSTSGYVSNADSGVIWTSPQFK